MYDRIKALIDERGITAYQVAKATGIATAEFSHWKNGRCKPGVEKLYKIAQFFGVPIEYFLKE